MTKLKDNLVVNLAMHQFDLAAAENELQYFIRRRDEANEKLRFGLVGLNGASLVALLSALGGRGSAATWLGFTPQNALFSALLFVAGLMLAGYSINTQQNLSTTESGDASARVQTLRRLVALYEQDNTQANNDRYGETLAEYHKLPLTGFQFSSWAITAQHFSGGVWLAGILIPLMSKLGPWLPTGWSFVNPF